MKMKNNDTELHLFIIWSNGKKYESQIMEDIKKRFDIKLVQQISWTEELFDQNLRRFYGKNLPKNSNKQKECGVGPFKVILVEDKQPIYAPRRTNQGTKIVNVNMFDSKEMYRRMLNGNILHATNSIEEFRHDLALLLHISQEDLIKSNFSVSDRVSEECFDIAGSNGWNSFEELLYIMNNSMNYVILRNFENLPEKIKFGKHSDLDILCENRDVAKLILNSVSTTKNPKRVQEKVYVGDDYINVDVRYLGDNYYDEKWEKNILETREYSNKGFYIQNTVNYIYTLIYHAIIQKRSISEDYIDRISDLCEELDIEKIDLKNEYKSLDCLKKYMEKHDYIFVEPIDPSVTYNYFKVGKKSTIKRKKQHFLRVFKGIVKGEKRG